MAIKNSWKDYFFFPKNERRGAIVLVGAILAVLLLPPLFKKESETVIVTPVVAMSAAESPSFNYSNTQLNDTGKLPPAKLFYFDPNTISVEGFISLGLRERTARTIINYRSKGGRFRFPDDIRKIYSLSKEEADRIVPYIKIKEDPAAARYNPAAPNRYSTYSASPRALQGKIDVNTAESRDWRLVPGMPGDLAYRITSFRARIGGFLTLDEVKQTYGLNDSIWKLIQPHLELKESTRPRININAANSYMMSMHPMFSKEVANAIVLFRNQNGAYASIADIKKIAFITEEMYKRLEPYISIE